MIGKLSYLIMMESTEIYPKYADINNKVETVFYVKTLNAIYGIMREELLFYKHFWWYN